MHSIRSESHSKGLILHRWRSRPPNAAALRNTVDIPAQAYISLQPPRLRTALQMSAVPLSAAVIHESLAHWALRWAT